MKITYDIEDRVIDTVWWVCIIGYLAILVSIGYVIVTGELPPWDPLNYV